MTNWLSISMQTNRFTQVCFWQTICKHISEMNGENNTLIDVQNVRAVEQKTDAFNQSRGNPCQLASLCRISSNTYLPKRK